jgi:hypothetical protein
MEAEHERKDILRYLFMRWIGFYAPHWVWMALPMPWRDAWAKEWLRRYYEERD